ncbi:hypothetical protein [Nocardioides cynanchi]|uniref:hypothetical protein n=1 Tax=Nocardioides cynanchi TaxID=2558918 RepID=UPI0012473DAE|nr:hypothetical protein [Nocardioides cynanchi]
MQVSEQQVGAEPRSRTAPVFDGTTDWATQTRRVLTRDLLMRAARAQPGESRALQFRALHLNLPLVAEAADRLGLTAPERTRVEHVALEALAQALRDFDPDGPDEFAGLAAPVVEREMLAHRDASAPTARQLRRTVRQLMLTMLRGRG